jgi:hypothetical protein
MMTTMNGHGPWEDKEEENNEEEEEEEEEVLKQF